MKSQFARIKNRASLVSTRALAVMLCFVMLLTAVGAGTMMTAIAADGAATPVTDAAQKVIDIADSVDVSAAAAAEDEAPTETVFDKLKQQLSELSSADADDEAPAPKKKKAELAETGDGDTTYYLWKNTSDDFSSFSKVGEMTGDGTVSGSFTHSGTGNVYFIINNDSTSVSSGNVITSSFSGLTVTNSDSSLFNNASCKTFWDGGASTYVYSVNISMRNGNERTINVTYDPSTSTITYGGSSSGGGGTTPTEAPTESSKVYFSKPAGWGNNVYAYFYSSTYWNQDKGTGSQNILNSGDGVQMSQDADYTDYYSTDLVDSTSYVVFTNVSQNDYEFFYGNSIKVALKMNGGRTGSQVAFSSATPVYTPDTSTSVGLNPSTSDPHATYYLSGTWSALPEEYHNVTFSQPTGGTITVNGEDHGPISVNRRGTFTVNVTPDHGFVFKSLSVGGVDVTASVSSNSYTGTMGTSDITVVATFEYAGKVTDTDLKAVLAGTKIMFYGGELTGWGQDYFKLNNSNDADKKKEMTGEYQICGLSGDDKYEFGLFCIASAEYEMGHWNSGLKTTPVAGKAYVVRDKTTLSGHTQKAQSGSNYLYELSNNETTTVTTTFPATVYQGYTAPVATGAPGKSVLGLTNNIEYYVKDGDNYYQVEADDGYIDTSAFAVKNGYKLITVLKDERDLRVVAHTNDFNVVAPDLKTIKVKSNNSRLGTANLSTTSTVPGQKVTVDIVENMGTFSSIAVTDANPCRSCYYDGNSK